MEQCKPIYLILRTIQHLIITYALNQQQNLNTFTKDHPPSISSPPTRHTSFVDSYSSLYYYWY